MAPGMVPTGQWDVFGGRRQAEEEAIACEGQEPPELGYWGSLRALTGLGHHHQPHLGPPPTQGFHLKSCLDFMLAPSHTVSRFLPSPVPGLLLRSPRLTLVLGNILTYWVDSEPTTVKTQPSSPCVLYLQPPGS